MVPPPYRKDTVVLALHTLLAGHLGVDKTYGKVLCHFYWLEVHSDVKKYCRMCRPSQLAGKPNQHPSVSPLIPIPVMEELLVGLCRLGGAITHWQSIPATIMCASAHSPEAISQHDIKAEKIVKALVNFLHLLGSRGWCSQTKG